MTNPNKMYSTIFTLVLMVYLTTFAGVAAYYHNHQRWRETNSVGLFRSAVESTERPRLRHSNYGKVMQRLESMQELNTRKPSRSRTRTSTTTTTTTTTEGALFEDYDEDDEFYDDDVEDGGSWKSGEVTEQTDEDDYEEDEPENDYVEEEVEKPQRQPPSSHRPVSPLTAQKWRDLGDRKAVEATRRNSLRLENGNYAVWAAVQHSVLMSSAAKCQTPSPRVIPVQSIHPDNTKEYQPHCTILHRCAEDTGCCANDAMKCAPKKQEEISLYFYARTLGVKGVKVEHLKFVNHTECACQRKQRNEEVSQVTSDGRSASGISVRSAEGSQQTFPSSYLRRCKCPKLFSPVLQADFRCACDCPDSDQNCQMLKRGTEHFSLTDRKCILSKHCAIPRCHHGTYSENLGKCPSLHRVSLDSEDIFVS